MLHLNHSVALHFTEFFCRCKNSHNSWINIILILELDELDEGSLSWMIFRHDKYYNNLTLLELLRASETTRQNLLCCKTSVSYCRFETRCQPCFTVMTSNKSLTWIKTLWSKWNFEDFYGNIRLNANDLSMQILPKCWFSVRKQLCFALSEYLIRSHNFLNWVSAMSSLLTSIPCS